jgi:hypothetical protein
MIVNRIGFGDAASRLLELAPITHQLFVIRTGVVICFFIKVGLEQ